MEIEVEELSFYYEAMVRSNLVELSIETPQEKILLKRRRAEEVPAAKESQFFRRQTDFLPKPETLLPPTAKVIASPLMGTFYRSSSPQSPPLVKEGDTVETGATLCIVEAMKVMNEIKSDCRCKILKILAENGKPVSKSQPLFYFEPV